MKFKNTFMSVKDFTRLKREKKIKLDPSFQVGTDEASRWDKFLQRLFLQSVLIGSAPSPFVLVNIKEALEFNKDSNIDDDSIKYFQDLLNEGYRFLSIDGNNRSISLKNFVEGRIKLIHGKYMTEKGLVPVTARNDSYKNMNKNLKEKFDSIDLSVTEYTEIYSAECPVLFRNINSGDPLNQQHIRNSYPSEVAEYVRAKRDKFKKSFLKFMGPNELHGAMNGDLFIAKCISFSTNAKETDKKSLDSVYMEPAAASKVVKPGRPKTRPSDFDSVLTHVLANIGNAKTLVNLKKSTNSIFDYFAICWEYKQENIKIDNQKEFFNKWLETSGKLFADEDTTYPSLDTEEVFNWKTLVKKIPSKYGDYRRAILKEAIGDEFLIQQEDPDAYFSYDDKVVLWQKQDGFSTVTGNRIPFDEIGDSEKWHGDAIIPKDAGGKHEISNGQLIEAELNLKKSNKRRSV
jgi:hypothetical protein